jgi:hypothetical protein
MRKKEVNMMLSVNDDSLDDFDDDREVLILEILEDSVDLVIEKVWILILEIYFDEYLVDDLGVEGQRYVNEMI